ncbi:hypothetical protein [Hymenobacter terrenus]|uniref:hypothetical protein n=1 Tax=Hymenobacter terrenus TaxID=1629124 RepID=UPI00061914E7|nr:hypothetical protein [Hymenobacter terrenus]
MAYFNAGLRVFNVANPRQPMEVGHFLPPELTKRYGPMPKGPLVLQTEDVLVDRRGFIYLTDKKQGLWIVRYTRSVPEASPVSAEVVFKSVTNCEELEHRHSTLRYRSPNHFKNHLQITAESVRYN